MFSTSSAFPVTNYTIRNILVINNLRFTWHINFDIAFMLNRHVNYAFFNIIALFSNMLKFVSVRHQPVDFFWHT